jgi:hypothetical protein
MTDACPLAAMSDDMKKQQRIESKAQQDTFKQDLQGMDQELSKGAETERERGSKRPPTGAK